MDEPFLDDDGYPSEPELDRIRCWKVSEGFDKLVQYIQARWWNADLLFHEQSECFEISTGGWSGNEDLIGALQDNFTAWTLLWYSSKRGGHYVFQKQYLSMSEGQE